MSGLAATTVLAPAKLNLALSVGPPGADGLHPICSWMVTVDLVDELCVTRLPADRLSRYAILWHPEARCRAELDWSVTKDLAVRAHLALERHTERRLPVQMKLEKRIPVGGGLGGGSSDAAAMLRAVNELFDLQLAADELAEIGATIGSDVPFLVHGGSAVVEGIGEVITRQPALPDLNVVIAMAEVQCPTGEVYRAFDRQPATGLRAGAVAALARCAPGRPPWDGPFNDLSGPAREIAPPLEALARRLSDLAERPAHVSGSGSSLFVICDDALHAQALAEATERQLGVAAVAAGVHEPDRVSCG